jgi:formylglycine-generating enzyme required for sulfatase activity
VPVGDQSVRLRLIAGGGGTAPFYIMESKVWNGLYRAGGAPPPPDSDANGPDAPVTHITAEEAIAFAKVLGGRLPTPAEWDHAAGRGAVKRPTVTLVGGNPRVGRAKPQPTHGPAAGTDRNEYQLIDMAGNGREWTGELLDSKKILGTDPVSPTELVILRGRTFTHADGLTFDMLEYEQSTPQTQHAGARSPYTSFRVVIPVP